MIWQPYLDLLSKRPRAIKYSSIYNHFPSIWTDYLKNCTEEEQRHILRLLGDLLKNDDFSRLNEALEMASTHGDPSPELVKHCFYKIINLSNTYSEITIDITRPKLPVATRGLSHYDALLQDGGVSR